MLHGVDKVYRTSSALRHPVLRQSRRSYAANASNAQNIAVLGGGITGLATAYYLTKRLPRARITIFEGSDRLGGWLLSNRVPVSGGSVLFEAGPRSLRTANNGVLAIHLIDELDLQKDTIFTPNSSPAASHRYLYYPDRMVRMPHPSFGLWNILQTLLSEPLFKGVPYGVITEAFRNARSADVVDESVGDFFSRRFGRPMVDNVLSAVLHGIYAGDVYKMSARSLFPRQWRAEGKDLESVVLDALSSPWVGTEVRQKDFEFFREVQDIKDLALVATLRKTSVFTFKEGISMLVDRLARKIWDSGSTEVRTSTKVTSLRLAEDGEGIEVGVDGEGSTQRYDHVVSALSPTHLNSLIGAPEDRIPEIPAVTVMTVNMFFKNVQKLPPGPGAEALGFGYLIPRATPFEQNPERALGVVFDHAYSLPKITSRSSNDAIAQDTLDQEGTKVTVMLGGHWWDGWSAYPDEQEGLKMARSVLQRHLGITEAPEAFQVNLQRDCIPQYTVGHDDRLKTAHSNLSRAYKGKLRVAGSWVTGVGVNDCLRSAYDAARGLELGKDGTGLEHVGVDDYIRVKPQPREK